MPQKVRNIPEKKDEQIAKTLEDLSVIELKSLVYDRIGIIEQCQARIKSENEEIQKINAVIQQKSK